VTDSDSEQSSLVMLHIFGILVLGFDAAAFKFKFKLLSKPEALAAQLTVAIPAGRQPQRLPLLQCHGELRTRRSLTVMVPAA
jgi:hypothetical protein